MGNIFFNRHKTTQVIGHPHEHIPIQKMQRKGEKKNLEMSNANAFSKRVKTNMPMVEDQRAFSYGPKWTKDPHSINII